MPCVTVRHPGRHPRRVSSGNSSTGAMTQRATRPTPTQLARARRDPAQQRARGERQSRHTPRRSGASQSSKELQGHRCAPRDAAHTRKRTRRAAGTPQTRAAPCRRRRDREQERGVRAEVCTQVASEAAPTTTCCPS